MSEDTIVDQVKLDVYKLLGEDEDSKEATIVEYIICGAIIFNVILIIVESVVHFKSNYSITIDILRNLMFIFFSIEYILRLWIADLGFKGTKDPVKSRVRFIFSLDGVLSLLALLPVVFPSMIIDFRVFRILRLFRVTKLHMLDDYSHVLMRVLRLKRRQLISSFFMLLVFTLASAIVIYDLEHAAQPAVFDNILSSLWWAVSTITTIGYGDMYPITSAGKTLGSIISLCGVFVIAIPIGILSAGFFDISKSLDREEEAGNRE